MFGRKQSKQQKKLQKLVKKYVKQGYRVEGKGEDFASLYKPSMSLGGRMMKTGATMATLGIAGRNHQADIHKTIYIFVNETGKASVTKGKARV